MCEIIIDGKTVKFKSSVLTQYDLRFYQETANHIIICDSVIEIRDGAFAHFSRLTSIKISNSVKVIGEAAFAGCSSLKTIVFPDLITELRYSICRACKSLENVVIPDSVKSIGDYAFWECTSLTSINLPDTVVYVGKSAFAKCNSLKSINIPKSIMEIGTYAFYECDNIRVKLRNKKDDIISKTAIGKKGQIITIDTEDDEYPILTCSNGLKSESMVIESFVDYACGKIYSGYKFNGKLDPQNKEPLYCFEGKGYLLYDVTTDGLKAKLKRTDIR